MLVVQLRPALPRLMLPTPALLSINGFDIGMVRRTQSFGVREMVRKLEFRSNTVKFRLIEQSLVKFRSCSRVARRGENERTIPVVDVNRSNVPLSGLVVTVQCRAMSVVSVGSAASR